MKCPVCNENLNIAYKFNVEIDYCPKCRGIWLDRGELEKIIELSINQEYSSYNKKSKENYHYDKDYHYDKNYNEYHQEKNYNRSYDESQYYYDKEHNKYYDKYYENHRYYDKHKKKKKFKSFLEELFDIF